MGTLRTSGVHAVGSRVSDAAEEKVRGQGWGRQQAEGAAGDGGGVLLRDPALACRDSCDTDGDGVGGCRGARRIEIWLAVAPAHNVLALTLVETDRAERQVASPGGGGGASGMATWAAFDVGVQQSDCVYSSSGE